MEVCIIFEELAAAINNCDAFLEAHPDLEIPEEVLDKLWGVIYGISKRVRPNPFLRSTDWRPAGRI